MTEFRTIVRSKPSSAKIAFHNGILTVGSCFSDAIGSRLRNAKFNVSINPFGTTYNPLSIHKAVSSAISNGPPQASTFVCRDELYFNYDFHSSFAATDKAGLEHQIRSITTATHDFLSAAKFLFVTYGTSWVYTRVDTGEVVSNCHKIPASNFKKRLMKESEIQDSFSNLHQKLKKFNPSIRIIVTVSPVRHLKDTLELNSVSKAILRSACHQLTEAFPDDVFYFPAYEMMVDDLRDYRFYKSDMLHPTEQAEDYIWENFKDTFFTPETSSVVDEWTSLNMALKHKAFHPASASHQQFLKATLRKLLALKQKINIDSEIAAVEQQIVA
jgi:hypothetical protein